LAIAATVPTVPISPVPLTPNQIGIHPQMVFGEITVHEATGRIVTPKVAGSEILREHRAGATLWIVPACWRPLPR
jgi:hypothetical protein